jgi:hypothetical protein
MAIFRSAKNEQRKLLLFLSYAKHLFFFLLFFLL